jgi:hypothetical protein
LQGGDQRLLRQIHGRRALALRVRKIITFKIKPPDKNKPLRKFPRKTNRKLRGLDAACIYASKPGQTYLVRMDEELTVLQNVAKYCFGAATWSVAQ